MYTIKQICNQKEALVKVQEGNGDKNKKSVPIYDGLSDQELFLITINEFPILMDSFPAMVSNANINKTINSFRECIHSDAKRYVNQIVTTGNTATEDTFNNEVLELTENIIGEEAHEDQVAYLRRTAKPHGRSLQAWIQHIQHINGLLPHMK